MKRKRPKNKPVKARVPREKQADRRAQFDALQERVMGLDRVLSAVVEAVGQEAVRKAAGKLASDRSLAALAQYVAAGKLVEAQKVSSPGTCAVEVSQVVADSHTDSIVIELTAVPADVAVTFANRKVGDEWALPDTATVRLKRVWDVVTP